MDQSGAPGWTLEAAGFDLSKDGEAVALAGAAYLDGIRGGRLQGEKGLWPTGTSEPGRMRTCVDGNAQGIRSSLRRR